MRTLALSALALVSLAAGLGCHKVTTEGPLDLQPWAKSFEGGAGSFVSGTSIASGPEGDVLLGGMFGANVDFGGGYLVNDGGSAVFVAHLDEEGNHLFSGSTGSNDSLSGVAVGPGGELYATGTYDGAINFGTGKLTGYKNGYLAAFQAGGASDFSLALGGSAEDWADDVAVTPAGDVVVAVRAGDDANFGGGAQSASFTRKDAVVVAYSPTGKHLWEVHVPDAVSGNLSVASDSAGNIVLTGLSYSPIQIGGLASAEGGAFIAKISATGTPLWLQVATSTDGAYPYLFDAVAGPDGGVVVSGASYYGTFTIGGVSSAGQINGSLFWLSLSPSGEVRHLHPVAVANYYNPPQLAVAPDGDVILGMTAYEAVDFGGGLVGTGPEQNALLARFTPEGEHVRSMEIEGSYNEYLADLAVDPDGNTLVLGWFDAGVEIAGTKLTTDQGNAMFVARLDL